jgi:hypothetical protein
LERRRAPLVGTAIEWGVGPPLSDHERLPDRPPNGLIRRVGWIATGAMKGDIYIVVSRENLPKVIALLQAIQRAED